jgi:hypothetical protein
MSEQTINIRRLLKSFGIQADEAVVDFFSRNSDIDSLTIRLTLEDITAYGRNEPAERLVVQLEGEIGP